MIFKEIEDLKTKFNISDIGIIKARRLSELEDYLIYKEKIEFEEKDLESRLDPRVSFEAVKSIIMCSFNYKTSPKVKDELSDDLTFSDEKYKDGKKVYRGQISMSSWGLDYHKVLMNKTSQLAEELAKTHNFSYRVMVDINPLPERYLAELCGIGSRGKNCSLIGREGSYVFLATILTDWEVDGFDIKDHEFKDICGTCDLCLRACPTKAITEAGYSPKRCISYLTQTKRDIDEKLLKKMGNSLYGCDICQRVCPYNKDVEDSKIEEFQLDFNPYPNLLDFMKKSKGDLKEYSKMSGMWRGHNILKRNALIALYNLNYRDLDFYKHYAKSKSELVSSYAMKIIKMIEEENKQNKIKKLK